MGPKSENSFHEFDKMLVNSGDHFSQHYCMGGTFRTITGCILEARTQYVDFGETDFTSKTDFIIGWYSAANICLLNNNQFYFQCNSQSQ
jgi:hypothetical protein